MPLPSYQISFISCRTGDVQYILDPNSVDDLQYSRALNDISTLAFSMPAGNPYAIEIQRQGLTAVLDDFIEISRTDPISGDLQVEETYLLRLAHRFRENNEERLAIGAYSLNHLLKRRIVDPDDDPFQAGGYSTKAGAASSVMFEYTVQQAGIGASVERQIPLLDVPALGPYGVGIGARLRHENLFDALKGFTERGQCDMRLVRTDGRSLRAEFQPIGVDRRRSTNYPLNPYLILDPLRGNLSNPSLLYDRKDEENFVYALGQGQGANRKLLKIAGPGVFDSPFNRIEYTEDVRNAQKADALTLFTEANKTLKEKQPRYEFSFTPTGVEAGNTYRQDWDIGDYITVQWDDLELDLRFYSVEIQVTSADEAIRPIVRTI